MFENPKHWSATSTRCSWPAGEATKRRSSFSCKESYQELPIGLYSLLKGR